ncbi:MAG: hypothetical protein LIP06_09085 [Tannerellaceae bacterium]|nr:hypothetical protein [Tannerellaceae bacterium]
MKKEYKHDKENQKNDKLKEPALVYSPTTQEAIDKSYYRSVEELIEGARQGTKEIEEGKFYTDDELDDLILR